ncbi:MAG: cyclic nucleotide-binding domain-containing protein [bacterium]|nr:cyclic nucleotide-binding domain-containing protein [bacterium]MDT8395579.1 cyclic nucleotide-binding domain-containing protein [bacterium]
MMEKMSELTGRIGKTFGAGDVVFQQGDTGDTMYIIHTGTLAVIRETEGTGTVVARLNPGDFVGEMALVDQEPRSATVKAIEEATLVPITRSFLLKHSAKDTRFVLNLMESLSARLERVDEMLKWRFAESGPPAGPADGPPGDEPRSAAFLKSFSASLDPAALIRVNQGDIIFRTGDAGDVMYIILDGEVHVSQEEGGQRFVQARFGRGHFFGEMALVSGRPRVATAIAAAPSVLMPLTRETFLQKVQTDPEVALHTVQILIVRLRRSLQMLD